MAIVIDDSAFPNHPTPMFSALEVGATFRWLGKYYQKSDVGHAYSFADRVFAAIGEVECQPVKATLVITAP